MGHLFHQHVTADASHFHNYTYLKMNIWNLFQRLGKGKPKRQFLEFKLLMCVYVMFHFNNPAQDKEKGLRFMVKHSSHLCKQ